MAKDKLPVMPFYVSDFLGSSRVQELPWQERHAYAYALFHTWNFQGQGLPGDDEKLAQLLGMTLEEWGALKDGVLQFFVLRGGRYHNERIDKELRLVTKKIAQRKKAAHARWGKRKKDVNEHANAMQMDMQTDMQNACGASGYGYGYGYPSSSSSETRENLGAKEDLEARSEKAGFEGNPRPKSEEVRNHYFKLFGRKKDQSWTRCLSHLDWRVMEGWSVDDLKLAADRYRMDVPPENIPVSCGKFYQDDFKAFLDGSWKPPEKTGQEVYRDEEGKLRIR